MKENGRKKWAFMLAGILLFLTVKVNLVDAEIFTFQGRTTGDTNYYIYKNFERYEVTSSDTCYNGQAWCTKTVHDNVKLKHLHFTENFTAQQADDMDRYAAWKWPSDFDSKIAGATTTFNCHSYALGPNQNVWNTDQGVTLLYDYDEVAGTCNDPYAVGNRCKHTNDHSSVIHELNAQYIPASSAVKKINSKWGGYGTYRGKSVLEGYGGVTNIYKPK